MWPFRKKTETPPPEDVVLGKDRAQYSTFLDEWEFVIDGVDFTLSGRVFNLRAFGWARDALVEMRRRQDEIDRKVVQHLGDWFAAVETRRLLCVSLDDYASEGHIDIAFTGDEWGDYGIRVILAGGEIIDVHGGD